VLREIIYCPGDDQIRLGRAGLLLQLTHVPENSLISVRRKIGYAIIEIHHLHLCGISELLTLTQFFFASPKPPPNRTALRT
jgi:hypothetical protein